MPVRQRATCTPMGRPDFGTGAVHGNAVAVVLRWPEGHARYVVIRDAVQRSVSLRL